MIDRHPYPPSVPTSRGSSWAFTLIAVTFVIAVLSAGALIDGAEALPAPGLHLPSYDLGMRDGAAAERDAQGPRLLDAYVLGQREALEAVQGSGGGVALAQACAALGQLHGMRGSR